MRWLLLWMLGVHASATVDEGAAKQYKTLYSDPDVADARYGIFSLKAHRANYFLPLSYASEPYPSYVESEEYRQIESKMQLSLRFDLFYDLLGLGEIVSLAYTQKAYWQNYTPSSPFRENLYNPEAFITVPLATDATMLRALTLGYAHQSNGQGMRYDDDGSLSEVYNRSRTWNYLYTTLHTDAGAFGAELTLWARILKTVEDGTPDLEEYLGYGSLTLRYAANRQWWELLLRGNPATGMGAAELTFSYPLWWRDDVFWYVDLFSGYGESLIDYNREVNKFSVGISFSR